MGEGILTEMKLDDDEVTDSFYFFASAHLGKFGGRLRQAEGSAMPQRASNPSPGASTRIEGHLASRASQPLSTPDIRESSKPEKPKANQPEEIPDNSSNLKSPQHTVSRVCFESYC